MLESSRGNDRHMLGGTRDPLLQLDGSLAPQWSGILDELTAPMLGGQQLGGSPADVGGCA